MASHRGGVRRGNVVCVGVSGSRLSVHPVITHNITVITHNIAGITHNIPGITFLLKVSLGERLAGHKIWLKSRAFEKNKQLHLCV